MSDYLRARIDALEKEVSQLTGKIEFLSAQLEVAKEAMFNDNKFQEL